MTALTSCKLSGRVAVDKVPLTSDVTTVTFQDTVQ